jgi:mono/diheme cytochrome c family protein
LTRYPIRLISLCWLCATLILAQTKTSQLKLDSGKEIFQAACAGCHGPDGKGQPQALLGFDPPATFPDFSDCPTTTPEQDIQWKAIITNGGKARGFTEIMPSFKEALTSSQVDMVLGYVRTLCTDPKWPRAELNLPRPLYTEKAFPENETVITNTAKDGYFNSTVIYEKRFGARTNMEFVFPLSFARGGAAQPWYGGVGDVTVEFKRVVYYNQRTGSLLTGAGEFNFATGNKPRGLGNGVTIVEPFLSYAQLLPRRSFFQLQTGIELPTHLDDRPKESFLRTAVGKSWSPDAGLGRTWSPMMEFLVTREHKLGERTDFDISPQLQVTLAKRQHIRASGGARIPVNNRLGRSYEVGFYLLWDWFDGGFRDGWK